MLVIPADEMEGGSSGGGGLATAGAEGETAVSGEGGGVGPEAAGSGGNGFDTITRRALVRRKKE